MLKHVIRGLAALSLGSLPLFVLAQDSDVEVVVSGDVVVVEEVPADTARAPREAPRTLPTRGMDMRNVRNVFGEPAREHAAVGEPPITRWDYDGYSVFFEHDKVLHAVVTG